MTYLYDRRWRLQVGEFATEELRVTFDITRSLDWHSNLATISVYNLARATRDQFDKGQSISLLAGYRDSTDLIFSGIVTYPQTMRSGPDWITTLECGDGSAAFGQYIRQTYSAGAPLTVVVGNIATAMGLTLSPEAKALLGSQVTRGKLVQSGLAPIALQTVLSSYNLQWSIQSGILQVLPAGGSTSEQAVLLSPQTGLIGSPELNQTDRSNKQNITAKSLLQGSIKPGRRVVLQSATINGTYVADEVQHRGDSRGDTWETEINMVAA